MKRHTFLTTLLSGLGGSLLGPITHARTNGQILLQESPLAGYPYHRASAVWSFLQEGEALGLKREPLNPYDPNAIAVWFRNEKLGYVPRRENRALARMMDRGARLNSRINSLSDNPNPWSRLRFNVSLIC
ncbi:MAG: HIRAN domain-containing protein [Sedimenticola sp.]